MMESVQTIPHFSVSAEVDAQQLLNLYNSLKPQDKSAAQVRVTLTDLLLKALTLALQAVPEANASWTNDTIKSHSSIDLALAISTDRGVVAPVMRDIGRKTLAEIVAKRYDLVERARRGRLAIADLEGGVGALTNLGMYEVDDFQAIITPGQSFILATGRIRERPWVEKTMVIRPTIRLTRSMDHRVADGVTAARLLTRISEIIAAPISIVANLSELLPK
jgi:pyruvate dehydrogenase E2 component (dihydrolipoamide acetyltransferase)